MEIGCIRSKTTRSTITGYNGLGGNLTIPNQIQLPGSQNNTPVRTVGNGTTPIFGMDNTTVTQVIIPYGVTNIAFGAFWEAKGLQEIIIPDGVTSIGRYAFAVCLSINNINMQDSVNNLGSEAFYRCSNLTNIKLSKNISSLKYSVFSLCEKLTQINIPQNIYSIEDYAFVGTSLAVVTIPASIQTIGNSFINCTNLAGVYFLGNMPTSTGTWDNTPATVYVLPDDTSWNSTFAGRPVVKLSGTQVFNLGKQNVLDNPNLNYLYTESQYSNNYSVGQQSILNSPNSHGLYTTNQIKNLGLGGIILNQNTNNQLVLNYQILQSSDLQNWTTYQQYELPITNAPSDKMFLRVQAVGP